MSASSCGTLTVKVENSSGQAGRLVALADDALQVLIERVVAEVGAVFDVEFETANRAQPHHRRRRHGEDEGILDRR